VERAVAFCSHVLIVKQRGLEGVPPSVSIPSLEGGGNSFTSVLPQGGSESKGGALQLKQNKKAVITGSTGLIGSYLADKLATRG